MTKKLPLRRVTNTINAVARNLRTKLNLQGEIHV